MSGVLSAIARRLRHRPPADLMRNACGRFAFVRAGYSALRSLTEPGSGASVEPAPGVVADFDAAAAVTALRRDSVFTLPPLRQDTVAVLTSLALTQPIRCHGPQYPVIPFDEVLQYNRERKGPPLFYGAVQGGEDCPQVRALVDDPLVLQAATQFLRYCPRRRRARLQWSFVCDVPPRERMARGQTVFYHYDVDDYNFVYVMYYLTDTDENSGAHAMITGTHRGKPLAWLLGRTWRTDEEVFACYPRSRELVLTGPAGFGFIQDSSCLHKALPPVVRPRLVLQVRYS